MTKVCIAGMHRSGTSMVAHLINLCGVYLGDEDDLIPAHPDNTEGFWENKKFVSINDSILGCLKAGWDLEPSKKSAWATSPEILPLYQPAHDLIDEFEHWPHWGWKDPRNSITLDFWKQLVPDMKVLICLRNPIEVMRSLGKRGLSSNAFGLNLWHVYNQSLLSEMSSEKTLITHYDSYFLNPQAELERILHFLEIPVSAEVVEQACITAKISLRHNFATFSDLEHQAKKYPELVSLYTEMCEKAGPVYWGEASFGALSQLLVPADFR